MIFIVYFQVNNATYTTTVTYKAQPDPLYENSATHLLSNGLDSSQTTVVSESALKKGSITNPDYDRPAVITLTAGKHAAQNKNNGNGNAINVPNMTGKANEANEKRMEFMDLEQDSYENCSPLKMVKNERPLRAVSKVNKKLKDEVVEEEVEVIYVEEIDEVFNAPEMTLVSETDGKCNANGKEKHSSRSKSNSDTEDTSNDYVNVPEKIKKPESKNTANGNNTKKDGKTRPTVAMKPKKQKSSECDDAPRYTTFQNKSANKADEAAAKRKRMITTSVDNPKESISDDESSQESGKPYENVHKIKPGHIHEERHRGRKDKERSRTHIGISLEGILGTGNNTPLKKVPPEVAAKPKPSSHKLNASSKGVWYSRSFENIHDLGKSEDSVNIKERLAARISQSQTLQVRPILRKASAVEEQLTEETVYEVPDDVNKLHADADTEADFTEDQVYTPMDGSSGQLGTDEDCIQESFKEKDQSDFNSSVPPPPCLANYANFSPKTDYANVFPSSDK